MKEDKEGKYIELNAFLKSKNIVTTGGQAKLLIRSGEIKVDGQSETRVKRKLRQGAVVEYKEKKYVVD